MVYHSRSFIPHSAFIPQINIYQIYYYFNHCLKTGDTNNEQETIIFLKEFFFVIGNSGKRKKIKNQVFTVKEHE